MESAAKPVSPLPTVVPVWVLAVVGVLLIPVFAPGSSLVWLPILFGICTLAAFGLQLSIPTSPNHVDRLILAIGGALIVCAVATAVYLPFALLQS